MTLRIVGENLDRSEAQFTFDRLLKEYFAKLPEIGAQATSYEGRRYDLASDTGNDCTASTVPELQPAGVDEC